MESVGATRKDGYLDLRFRGLVRRGGGHKVIHTLSFSASVQFNSVTLIVQFVTEGVEVV
jgi:hypothetical protein